MNAELGNLAKEIAKTKSDSVEWDKVAKFSEFRQS